MKEETILFNQSTYFSPTNPPRLYNTIDIKQVEPEIKAKEEEIMNYYYRDIKVSTYYTGSICIETGLNIYTTKITKKGKILYIETCKGTDKSIDCHSETVTMIKQRLEILKKNKKCGTN